MKLLLGRILVLAGFVILCGLGWWQLERGFEKKMLIEQINHALQLPPLQLPVQPNDSMQFRHAEAEGNFVEGEEFYLPRGDIHSGKAGYHLIQPFRLRNGELLLVNRGFIPLEWRGRARPYHHDKHSIKGIVRIEQKPSFFMPHNDPERNFWFFMDIKAMMDHRSLGPSLPYYLDEEQKSPLALEEGDPIGGQTQLELRDEHLSYALTWFLLAFSLLVISFLAGRTRPRTFK